MSMISNIVMVVVGCILVAITFAGAIFGYLFYKNKIKDPTPTPTPKKEEMICYIDEKKYIYTEADGVMYFKSEVKVE